MIVTLVFVLSLAFLLGFSTVWVFPKWSMQTRLVASAGAFLLAAIALLVVWVVAAHSDRGGRPVTQEELERAAEQANKKRP